MPRLQTLLAYLLLQCQAPTARQQIAFQFWPDSSEKQAHTNLRKLLFQLRNALPDPDFILPGQVIIVPNVGTIGRVIGPPCVQAYFVQAGDTWESLATRFGTTTAILQRANPGALALGRAIWAPRN